MSRGFLLDTHTLLWWLFEAELLSYHPFEAISGREIDIYVSAVSAMEIATKHRIGKLSHATPLIGHFGEVMADEGFKPLAVEWAHAERAGSFPSEHGDPWDRLLAAQSQIEELTLISSDRKMQSFGIECYW